MRWNLGGRSYHGRILLGFVLAALLAVAGCGSLAPSTSSRPSTPSAPSATSTAPAASTATWTTYTDNTYHFKTLIPPGWRIETTLDNTVPNLGGPCTYDVIFFPPGDTHHADPVGWMQMKEVMIIFVNLNCPPPDERPNHLPESSATVTISGVPAAVYGEDTADGVKRVTFAHFSDHIYGFYVFGPLADGPLYMRVLSGFVHAGA